MKYVAFLRGINVGGRVVKMADLKACFEKLGFKDVQTIAQTGNVLFESDKSAGQLKKIVETGLTERFKYDAKVQILSVAKVKKIVADSPLGAAGPNQHNYVIFMENGLEQTILGDKYELGAGEEVKPGQGVVYWRVDQGQTLRSSFGKTLSKAKYKNFNTNRNLNTLQKILSI